MPKFHPGDICKIAFVVFAFPTILWISCWGISWLFAGPVIVPLLISTEGFIGFIPALAIYNIPPIAALWAMSKFGTPECFEGAEIEWSLLFWTAVCVVALIVKMRNEIAWF